MARLAFSATARLAYSFAYSHGAASVARLHNMSQTLSILIVFNMSQTLLKMFFFIEIAIISLIKAARALLTAYLSSLFEHI